MEITPLTKVGALLETHPELAEALIERVPAFAKLRNPILRATVETWPAWYRASAVVVELDAAAMLAKGEHPMGAIKQTLARHPPGAIVAVTSDFMPAPLLDQMAKEGILTACVKEGPLYRTCLRRP